MSLLVYEILSSICRLTKLDFQEPLNINSDETVSMNEMANKFEKNFE
jgi:hypothetical protein